MLFTDKQTDRQANATKNITSFAKEVNINIPQSNWSRRNINTNTQKIRKATQYIITPGL